MQLLYTLFIGLLIGIVARFLKPGKQKMGLILTSLLGVGGSFVASYVGSFIGLYSMGEPAGFIASVLGAISLLVIGSLLKK